MNKVIELPNVGSKKADFQTRVNQLLVLEIKAQKKTVKRLTVALCILIAAFVITGLSFVRYEQMTNDKKPAIVVVEDNKAVEVPNLPLVKDVK